MEEQKKRCLSCEQVVSREANFCPDCGSKDFELVDKDITTKLRPQDSP